MARRGGGPADQGDPGRPGFAFWRRRQRAEADAREARAAAAEAEARLAEAREATAAAEQEARAAREQAAAARLERDEAVTGAQSRAAGAQSRAGQAGQAGQDAAEPARADDAEAERSVLAPTVTRRPSSPPGNNPKAQPAAAGTPGKGERRRGLHSGSPNPG